LRSKRSSISPMPSGGWIEARRGPALKIALGLQVGFLRMTARLLEAVRRVPPALWQHLGQQFNVAAADLASLRAMYRRRRTLFEHQEVACEALGFHWLSEAQRRALKRVVRDELARTSRGVAPGAARSARMIQAPRVQTAPSRQSCVDDPWDRAVFTAAALTAPVSSALISPKVAFWCKVALGQLRKMTLSRRRLTAVVNYSFIFNGLKWSASGGPLPVLVRFDKWYLPARLFHRATIIFAVEAINFAVRE
jgi:Domain of unknown function (DUF4158)